MQKKLKSLLVFTLCITLLISSNVYAGTAGSIPFEDNTDTWKNFYYDVDGYINAGGTYILPNPYDEDDEFDFLIPGSNSTYVYATLDNQYVSRLTLRILVYSTSGTLIKQYSTTANNASTVSYTIPAQGANRNIRITISSSDNARVFEYGLMLE